MNNCKDGFEHDKKSEERCVHSFFRDQVAWTNKKISCAGITHEFIYIKCIQKINKNQNFHIENKKMPVTTLLTIFK